MQFSAGDWPRSGYCRPGAGRHPGPGHTVCRRGADAWSPREGHRRREPPQQPARAVARPGRRALSARGRVGPAAWARSCARPAARWSGSG